MTALALTPIICPRCVGDGNLQRTFKDPAAYRWKCPIHGPVLSAVEIYNALPSPSKS